MNKDEYVIINKTKILKNIQDTLDYINEAYKEDVNDEQTQFSGSATINTLESVLFNSIELIPEIEKAIKHGLNSFENFDRNSNYDEESRGEGLQKIQEDYIKQLTLNL